MQFSSIITKFSILIALAAALPVEEVHEVELEARKFCTPQQRLKDKNCNVIGRA